MILVDKFNRPVELIQIAASASCQYNCSHCGSQRSPAWGTKKLFPTDNILSFVGMMARIGLKRARLSGGEPLLRPDIIDLISGLASIGSLESVSMSTNGRLLEEKAQDIAKSGLKRLFLTLPTLNKNLFHSITGADDLDKIINGMDTLAKIDSVPITVKMTVIAGVNDHEVVDMVKWCGNRHVNAYIVEGYSPTASGKVSEKEILAKIKGHYSLTRMTGTSPHNSPWTINETGTTLKIVTMDNKRNCSACNRFWLSVDGLVTMCSGVESTLDLKSVFDDDAGETALEEFAVKIALNKPIGVESCGTYPFPTTKA